MIKTIFLKDRYIKYELTRKNVKNINLRIKSDCNICVSANYFVSEKAVNNFLFKKADLIIKALETYSKRISSKFNFDNGDKISYLGREIYLSVIQGESSYCALFDDTLVLSVKDTCDIDEKKKLFYSWQKEKTADIISSLSQKHYEYFKEYCGSFPKLTFRKMKSRWGSCNYAKNKLTFNTLLISTPFECIEYVVVHEFAHFLVHNHSADFYKIINKVLPDYKERIKELKSFDSTYYN